jgi:hypothetical protein
MDTLLLVDEDHLKVVWAVAIIAKPSRRPSARYVLRALESPLHVVRQGSSRSSSVWRQLWSLSSRELVAVTWCRPWTSWRWTDGTHGGRTVALGGEALFMFSFKRAVAMDVALPLAATLDEDDILL